MFELFEATAEVRYDDSADKRSAEESVWIDVYQPGQSQPALIL